jgi:hypothetical protein
VRKRRRNLPKLENGKVKKRGRRRRKTWNKSARMKPMRRMRGVTYTGRE